MQGVLDRAKNYSQEAGVANMDGEDKSKIRAIMRGG
jgi:hypothetical protein